MGVDESNNIILTQLKQRENEYLQLITINEIMADITTLDEFNKAVNHTIKSIIGFRQLIIYIHDKSQKAYHFYYHSDIAYHNNQKNKSYSQGLKIFTSVADSPDPIILLKKEIKRTIPGSTWLKETFDSPRTTIISCSIPSRHFKGILFFGFEKEKNNLYLIKRLASQFGITLTNILLLEKSIKANITEPEYSNNNELAKNSEIIGRSQSMTKVRNLIQIVSKTESAVLINGESGTGKELIAKAIHHNSDRNTKDLIKINCAAIPRDLLESELFGYEKGSFTGAVTSKKGRFEQAHKGTLFLDEISEMPYDLQPKLLRVLQEKEIQRIGSNKSISVDFRVIAATNKNLIEEVNKGNFRADLFYRLNVFPIDIPPLREHIDDLPDLTHFFVEKYCMKNKKNIKTIPIRTLNILKSYNWPGNVRELEHTIERAVLMSSEKIIKDLQINNTAITPSSGNAVFKPLTEFEKEYILSAIKFCKGKISGPNGAAALLKIPSTTLWSKMQKYGIKKRHFF